MVKALVVVLLALSVAILRYSKNAARAELSHRSPLKVWERSAKESPIRRNSSRQRQWQHGLKAKVKVKAPPNTYSLKDLMEQAAEMDPKLGGLHIPQTTTQVGGHVQDMGMIHKSSDHDSEDAGSAAGNAIMGRAWDRSTQFPPPPPPSPAIHFRYPPPAPDSAYTKDARLNFPAKVSSAPGLPRTSPAYPGGITSPAVAPFPAKKSKQAEGQTPAPAANDDEDSEIRKYFQGLSYLFLIIIISSNLMVLTAYAKYEKLRTITHRFVISLAVADLCVGLGRSIQEIVEYVDPYDPDQASLTYRAQFFATVPTTMNVASLLSLLGVTIDRYISVTNPLRYTAIMTEKLANGIIVGAWCFAVLIIFVVPHFFVFWHGTGISPYYLLYRYILITYFVLFVSLLFIISIFYARIFYACNKHHLMALFSKDFSQRASTMVQPTPVNTSRKEGAAGRSGTGTGSGVWKLREQRQQLDGVASVPKSQADGVTLEMRDRKRSGKGQAVAAEDSSTANSSNLSLDKEPAPNFLSPLVEVGEEDKRGGIGGPLSNESRKIRKVRNDEGDDDDNNPDPTARFLEPVVKTSKAPPGILKVSPVDQDGTSNASSNNHSTNNYINDPLLLPATSSRSSGSNTNQATAATIKVQRTVSINAGKDEDDTDPSSAHPKLSDNSTSGGLSPPQILDFRGGGRMSGESGTPSRRESAGVIIASKATIMIAMIVGTFATLGLPLQIMEYILIFQVESIRNRVSFFIIHGICVLLYYSNSAVNPYIYAWKNRDFRDAFKRILTCNGRFRICGRSRHPSYYQDDLPRSSNRKSSSNFNTDRSSNSWYSTLLKGFGGNKNSKKETGPGPWNKDKLPESQELLKSNNHYQTNPPNGTIKAGEKGSEPMTSTPSSATSDHTVPTNPTTVTTELSKLGWNPDKDSAAAIV